MSNETIFTKIVRGDVDAQIVYRDDLVTAFRDIDPKAPTHVLIVPNEPIPTVDDVREEHEPIMGRMFTVARKVAEQDGLDHGYRLIVNCKDHGHQEVFHVHMHLLGGRPLGPMLAE